MRYILQSLIALAGIGSIGIGGYLCYHDSNGWGWFLGIGFLILLIFSGAVEREKENEE
jgi:MFS family permease